MPLHNHRSEMRKRRPARDIQRILILCEDTKSSRDYFEQFPHDPNEIEIACIGTGRNTDSLMLDAIERFNKAARENRPYQQVWVVFDKDSFSPQQYNLAIERARKHPKIEACWSNECFELWYLLHFEYRNSGFNRNEVNGLLSQHLGRRYDKADTSIHNKLREHQETALKHASNLAFINERDGTETGNPSTQVHKLVKLLLSHAPNRNS